VDVTTGPYRRVRAFRDAVLEGIVDVTIDPIRGGAFRDANLGGTVGVNIGL